VAEEIRNIATRKRILILFTDYRLTKKRERFKESSGQGRISKPLLEKVLVNSLTPFRFLTPFSIPSSRRRAVVEKTV